MKHIYEEPQFGENWFTYPTLYSRFVEQLECGKIVEVGSWKGKSTAYLAVEIINSGKKISIDTVDTWKGSPNEECHVNDPYVKTDGLYSLFLSNIEKVSSVINPIRMASLDAAKLYDDNSIDIVFIDACHAYECVKEDIDAWYPKVKTGGVIAGHDYNHHSFPGVIRAVNEAFGKDKIELIELCWVYRKP